MAIGLGSRRYVSPPQSWLISGTGNDESAGRNPNRATILTR